MKARAVLRAVLLIAAIALVAAACGSSSDDEPTSAPEPTPTDVITAEDEPEDTNDGADDDTPEEEAPEEPDEPTFEGELVGLFSLDPTSCDGADVSGSYFRMIQPGGALDEGPFVPNADSPCTDGTYSALATGSDGGLITGTYQPVPDPPFDDAGNGLSSAIAQPVKFFGVDFALGIDDSAALPSIVATGGSLSGDMSAWSAFYANLLFNQGSPKPDGSMPGLTEDIIGTIDPETGVYTLEWSSQIVGGSFNDFTGVWHLEGTFTPSS